MVGGDEEDACIVQVELQGKKLKGISSVFFTYNLSGDLLFYKKMYHNGVSVLTLTHREEEGLVVLGCVLDPLHSTKRTERGRRKPYRCIHIHTHTHTYVHTNIHTYELDSFYFLRRQSKHKQKLFKHPLINPFSFLAPKKQFCHPYIRKPLHNTHATPHLYTNPT